jgi:hypothetical protein
MVIPIDLWEKMIIGFPHCPVKELHDMLAGKVLTNANVKHVRFLLVRLKSHEDEIRAFRQDIEHKLRVFASESMLDNYSDAEGPNPLQD